jgi:hypothetical protein
MRIKLSIFLLLFTAFAAAQDTLSGAYSTLLLRQGTYVVRSSVSVDSSLTINSGVTVLFSENSTIVCSGSLNALGSADNRIIFQNADANGGSGLIIKSQNNDLPIQIRYVQFIGLSAAIRFDGGWTRKSVTISDCEFIGHKGASPVVSVLNPRYEAGLDNPRIPFNLERSVFTRNGSALYFEDLNSANLLVRVVNNVFANNRITDFGVYNFSGNVLYGRADRSASPFSAFIESNSFLQNFLVSVVGDTIVQRVSVGVFGNADSVQAVRNYWGENRLAVIQRSVYDFNTNYTAPSLIVEPFLDTPPFLAPTHIFRVCIVDSSSSQKLAACNLLDGGVSFNGKDVSEIHLYANKPLTSENAQVIFTWLDDSLLQKTSVLAASFRSTSDPNKIEIAIDTTDIDRFGKSRGYLTLQGFQGVNNETVPALFIGFETFLKEKYLLQKRADSLQFARQTINAQFIGDSTKTPLTQPSFPLKRSRFFLVGAINLSSQLISDVRPLQQLVFPVSGINNSFIQAGFFGAIRWDVRVLKPLSTSLLIGYTYLRPTTRMKHSDTLPPFSNQFTSFMPRSSFQLVGAQAGLRGALLSNLSVLAGGALDYNLTPTTSIDQQSPSYNRYLFSYYAGLEVGLPGRGQLPVCLVGIKWRRWLSTISVAGVSDITDLIELNTVFSLSRSGTTPKKSKK